MTTIFTKIINREIPAHILYEDDQCIVILDAFPSVAGQSLVIPKQEVDYIFELTEDYYQHLFAVAKRIATASDTALDTERTCLVIEGFEVPHVHIKLYPMPKGSTALTDVINTTKEAEDDELEALATQIRTALTHDETD